MTTKVFMQGLGLAVVLTVAAPLAAEAQGRFHGLDKNRDGVVTRAEWRGNDVSFRNQDRNRDGVLSGAELNRSTRTGRSGRGWSGHDANRDGRISRDEWPSRNGDFDVLDTNDDGWLSRAEVNAGRAARDRDWDNDNDRDDGRKVRGNGHGQKHKAKAPKALKVKPGKGKKNRS